MNPDVHIIVRTRYVAEIAELFKLGANEVIPEEFETSIEIFSRVLMRYGTPRNVIESQIDRIREQGYEMLRTSSLSAVVPQIPPVSVLDFASTESIFLMPGFMWERDFFTSFNWGGDTSPRKSIVIWSLSMDSQRMDDASRLSRVDLIFS